MRRIAQILSFLALAGLLAPVILFYIGAMDFAPMKTAMLAATILWFATAPLWMERSST